MCVRASCLQYRWCSVGCIRLEGIAKIPDGVSLLQKIRSPGFSRSLEDAVRLVSRNWATGWRSFSMYVRKIIWVKLVRCLFIFYFFAHSFLFYLYRVHGREQGFFCLPSRPMMVSCRVFNRSRSKMNAKYFCLDA